MLAEGYQAELNRLLEQLECRVQLPEEMADDYFSETGALPTSFDERRRFARFRFRTKAILGVRPTLPVIPRTPEKHVIYSYDMSRGGLAFLHSQQLFPMEVCDLWLPTQKLVVRVTRCQYLNENCYLIGSQPVGGDEGPNLN